jgi:hypothetical protein
MLEWIEAGEHGGHRRCRRWRDSDRIRKDVTATFQRAEEAGWRQIGLRERSIGSQAVDDQEEDGRPADARDVSVVGLHFSSN